MGFIILFLYIEAILIFLLYFLRITGSERVAKHNTETCYHPMATISVTTIQSKPGNNTGTTHWPELGLQDTPDVCVLEFYYMCRSRTDHRRYRTVSHHKDPHHTLTATPTPSTVLSSDPRT
jgi:hypothetical protein